ncbi:MAG: hypothetical protein E7Z77_00870 [Methanobrevibacter sp.]|uniref:hypothetical protein n=1 Tax=Methanobrevibacter sp. TaxID=66852 RepID=UPI0025E41A0C|nr:hypothetical protein [Methanobrevibacter sp.]MBE6507943.1 hypothetical protein [Methanobrevibacter sp.]
MQVGDYAVKPSSSSAEDDLIDFLRFNNFTHLSSFEDDGTKAQKAMVVNVVNKTYFRIDELPSPAKSFPKGSFSTGSTTGKMKR